MDTVHRMSIFFACSFSLLFVNFIHEFFKFPLFGKKISNFLALTFFPLHRWKKSSKLQPICNGPLQDPWPRQTTEFLDSQVIFYDLRKGGDPLNNHFLVQKHFHQQRWYYKLNKKRFHRLVRILEYFNWKEFSSLPTRFQKRPNHASR